MHRVQGRIEAGTRGDRGAGATVHVHDVQVPKLGLQFAEVAEVRRRLEHPAVLFQAPPSPLLTLLPLQELQHAVQIRVGGSEILRIEPGSVIRKVRAGFRDMRQERVGQKDDLLFGFARIHRMDGK